MSIRRLASAGLAVGVVLGVIANLYRWSDSRI